MTTERRVIDGRTTCITHQQFVPCSECNVEPRARPTFNVGDRVRARVEIVEEAPHETWPEPAISQLLEDAVFGRGDGRAVAARPGDVGRVEFVEQVDEGELLIVSFDAAPCAVGCSSDDVQPFLSLV